MKSAQCVLVGLFISILRSMLLAQSVIATIPLTNYPYDIAVNPKTNAVYVVCLANTVAVIDGNLNRVVKNIAVGNVPVDAAVNSNTNRIYVANNADNKITVIDGSRNQVITNVTLWNKKDIALERVAVNRVTNQIYAISEDQNIPHHLFVIGGSNNKVTAKLDVSDPLGLGVNSVTNQIFVTTKSLTGDNVFVFDGATNTIGHSFRAPSFSNEFEVVVDEVNNRLFLVDSLAGQVLAVDPATGALLGSTGGFLFLWGLDLLPNQGLGVVSDDRQNNVSYFDTTTFDLLKTVTVGNNPEGLAVNQHTGRVYVANGSDKTVSVLSAPQ